MLRHVALFSWNAAGPPDLAAVEGELATLVAGIDGADGFVCGAALGLSGPNSYDFGLSVDFVDAGAYQAYRMHEAHQQLLRDVLLPAASAVAAMQFDLPGR